MLRITPDILQAGIIFIPRRAAEDAEFSTGKNFVAQTASLRANNAMYYYLQNVQYSMLNKQCSIFRHMPKTATL
jgi:hypothetical protein